MRFRFAGFGLLVVALAVPSLLTRAEEPHQKSRPTLAAAAARTTGPDFNADGHADLVIGGSLMVDVNDPDGVPETTFPGVVYVLYGSDRGLLAARRQLWRGRDFAGGSDSEHFGAALAPGDFDGDGHTDLAVGIAAAGDNTGAPAGQVRVIYGSRQGLVRQRSQLWSQDTPGVAGKAAVDDNFGTALAAANFGAGVQDDLAVGASGDGPRSSGGVNVLYGSATGLTTAGNQHWSQATAGIPGQAGVSEQFGFSLAAGHFAARRYADLAIGVPQDRVGGKDGAGSINVLYGSATGLSAKGSQLWSQNSKGIKGKASSDEYFGNALAVGHFSGRVATELAVGAPGDNDYAGAVHVLRGSTEGLSARGDQRWNRRSKGLAPVHRKGHWWLGGALAAGNFGHDYQGRAYTDLAVQIDRGTADAGAVLTIYGSQSGLAARNSQGWTLNSPGIPGRAEPDMDEFGQLLAAANFGRDQEGRSYDDLAVGNPGDLSVTAVYGTSSGLKANGSQRWTPSRLTTLQSFFFPTSLAAG